jgi:hypothetical protein
LADKVLDGAKPLITLAFEGTHRALAEIRKGLIALVELLRAMFRRPVDGSQPPRTANRFENFAGLGETSANGGGAWLRFRALSVDGAAVGKAALRGTAECARVVLILCCRYGLAACRVVCRRALEFRRDGKVELTKGEAAVALLVLACFGVSLAWLISDTAPRAERLAGAPPTDGSALPAIDAVHKTDPIRAIVANIPSRELAELLAERPSLEGRLYWSEQAMPLPMLASLPDSETRLATTARPMPVPQREVIEIAPAGAPAAVVVPPTDEARPVDVVPPPSPSTSATDLSAREAPAPPTVASTEEPEIASTFPPEPPAPTGVEVSAALPKLALAPPPPRPEPLAGAGMGSIAIYQVQLVAVRAREQAWKMWESLLGKHQDVLGDLEPDISSRRTRNRRQVYRLRAGPIDSRSEARALCATLSKRKVDCLVVQASG